MLLGGNVWPILTRSPIGAVTSVVYCLPLWVAEAFMVLSATRTAIGKYGGGLAAVPPCDLAATVVREAVRRAGVQPDDVGHAVFGHVIHTEARDMYLSRVAAAPGLWDLATFFFKIGALSFGGGLSMLTFMQEQVVTQLAWLTPQEFVDGLALGQLTPGPVFTTATFIGYVLGGLPGALVATIAIFLPAFLLVAASGPLLPRIRGSKIAGSFLDGVNVASLAGASDVAAGLLQLVACGIVNDHVPDCWVREAVEQARRPPAPAACISTAPWVAARRFWGIRDRR